MTESHATQTESTPSMASHAGAPRPSGRVLSTLNADGSRRWLKPRPMPGRFMTWRRAVAWALIAFFAILPHLRLYGKPLVLLDLPARRFTIFGTTFLPTDTLLLALLLIGVFVGIFLLTALLGRVWCGWACPQTVYLEFVFRPIERFFDGAPGRRGTRWWHGSAAATVAKYVAFLAVAAFLAHTFLAYFVGVERLATWVRQSPFEHPAPFLVMAATTALMLFDFGFFREQTCIVACPYGRFQSVLLDRHSLIISYDQKRGEPRGPMRSAAHAARSAAMDQPEPSAAGAGAEAGRDGAGEGGGAPVIALPLAATQAPHAGDCVDCGMCTVCCPTGIDIRDGLQMECIGCAQCIDACDSVMDKLKRPRGLIRYSSQAAIAGGAKRILRPRVILYPAFLTAIAIAFAVVLMNIGGFEVTVLRGLGRPFTEQPDGLVGNPLRVKIVNRTDAPTTFVISASGAPGVTVEAEQGLLVVGPSESRTIPVIVAAPRRAFAHGRCPVTIEVADADGRRESRQFQLMGPGHGVGGGAGNGSSEERSSDEHHSDDSSSNDQPHDEGK